MTLQLSNQDIIHAKEWGKENHHEKYLAARFSKPGSKTSQDKEAQSALLQEWFNERQAVIERAAVINQGKRTISDVEYPEQPMNQKVIIVYIFDRLMMMPNLYY